MKPLRSWTLALVVIIGVPLAVIKAGNQFIWNHGIDYGRLPPAQVFQKVLDRKPPQGITNLRISGRSYTIKHWVWMRFNASNSAIKDLISHAEPSNQCRQYPDQSPFTKANVVDKKAVNWQQIQSIQKPECYQWGTYSNRKLVAWWFGIMIVDRKRNLVFIHGAME